MKIFILCAVILMSAGCVAVPVESIPVAGGLPAGEKALTIIAEVDSATDWMLPDVGVDNHPFANHSNPRVRQASRILQEARLKCANRVGQDNYDRAGCEETSEVSTARQNLLIELDRKG